MSCIYCLYMHGKRGKPQNQNAFYNYYIMQAHVAISNWQHTFWSYIWTPYIVQSIPAFFPRLSSYLRFTSSTMSCTYCDDKGVKKYVCFLEQDWQTQILPEALGWESSKVLETSSPKLFATWEVSFWGDGRHNIKYDFEACIQISTLHNTLRIWFDSRWVTVDTFSNLTFILRKVQNLRTIHESWITCASSTTTEQRLYKLEISSLNSSTCGCGRVSSWAIRFRISDIKACTWGTHAATTDSEAFVAKRMFLLPSPSNPRKWFLIASCFSHSSDKFSRSTRGLALSTDSALIASHGWKHAVFGPKILQGQAWPRYTQDPTLHAPTCTWFLKIKDMSPEAAIFWLDQPWLSCSPSAGPRLADRIPGRSAWQKDGSASHCQAAGWAPPQP